MLFSFEIFGHAKNHGKSSQNRVRPPLVESSIPYLGSRERLGVQILPDLVFTKSEIQFCGVKSVGNIW